MELKAGPESIRKILDNGKFRIEEPRPSSDDRIFLPVDAETQVRHQITTDSAYSYMLIECAG
jgi:hypothetical protein